MELCVLTGKWCSQCGGQILDPICYFTGEQRRVKDLKTCPRHPFKPVEPPKEPETQAQGD